jgi:hypothetical protein
VSTDILGAAGAGSGRIGRYFTVVSALPAAVFVVYVYLLIQTGALSGSVDWHAAVAVNLADVAVLGVASFLIALTMNPLQFALIQLFEGYWGTSAPAELLAVSRVAYHRHRRRRLHQSGRPAEDVPRRTRVPPAELRDQIRRDGSVQAYRSYPDQERDILPTRLGNVLRHYETSIGRQYGLDLLTVVPRLAMVGGEREIAYVTNQRIQLELALRTSLLALLAAPVTLGVMWRHGPWLLLALVPYSIAYLAYRGAVAVAHEYGASLAVLVDLGRFTLYRRVGLGDPRSIDDERRNNRDLMRLFRAEINMDPVIYRPATEPGPADSAATEEVAP